MKFDTIIIGGGLTGFTCALTLAKAGQNTALITAGQSTLHFNSGSIDLLGYDEQGQIVDQPLTAIAHLSSEHPYHKVGDVAKLAAEAQALLAEVDRKSTRLNSSHANISYAVFCLKKKK